MSVLPGGGRPLKTPPESPETPALGDRNVVLVGMRASGKTSVGRRLAERMGRPFLDLDDALAARAGRSADRVLAEDGEARFRGFEQQVLLAAAGLRGHVIATGGGAVQHADTFAALAEHAVVVYLQLDVDALVARDAGRPRPPLTDLPPAEEVAALLARRHPLYLRAAQIVVPVASGDPILPIVASLGIP